MYKQIGLTVMVFAFSGLTSVSQAADELSVSTPLNISQNPALTAFASGAQAFADGRTDDAVRAFEEAAEGGHFPARWKLGRIYQNGDGVDKDAAKAFEAFHRLAYDLPEIDPWSPNARFVGNAYVNLGLYYAEGIEGYLEPDLQTAENYLLRAASIFRDAEAQYHLGRILLDERYGTPRLRSGVRWLKLAAEKGHVAAQGLLGVSLIENGKSSTSHKRGLAWITIARKSVSSDDNAWIRDKHEEYFAAASEEERREAFLAAENWQHGIQIQ